MRYPGPFRRRIPVWAGQVEILTVFGQIVENVFVGQGDKRTVVVDDEIVQVVSRHDEGADGRLGVGIGVVGFGELQLDVQELLRFRVALKDGVVHDLAVERAGTFDELVGVGGVRGVGGRLDAEGTAFVVISVEAMVHIFLLFVRSSRRVDLSRDGGGGFRFFRGVFGPLRAARERQDQAQTQENSQDSGHLVFHGFLPL